MVLLRVTVVDGSLGELKPQEVIEWAKFRGVALTEAQLDYEEWTFDAEEERAGAIRTMLSS